MRYGNRSPWRKALSSPLTLVGAVIILVILGRAAWNVHQKANMSSARLEQAQVELAKLTARRVDLSDKVASLSTPEGIETEMRTKYRAVRDGELVAVIVDDATTTLTVQASSTPPTVSWWRRFLRMFGF